MTLNWNTSSNRHRTKLTHKEELIVEREKHIILAGLSIDDVSISPAVNKDNEHFNNVYNTPKTAEYVSFLIEQLPTQHLLVIKCTPIDFRRQKSHRERVQIIVHLDQKAATKTTGESHA